MRRTALLLTALTVLLLASCARQAAPKIEPEALVPPSIGPAAAPTELFFSEYVEGSSFNKALEVFNGTGAAVDLAVGGYSVQMFFNGSTSPGTTIALTGTLAGGDVYVLAEDSADPAILAVADQVSGASMFNGDDAVALLKDGTIIDVIGQIGVDPGSQWGSGDASTQDNTLRRNAGVCAGDPNGDDPFDPSIQWAGFAENTFEGLGSHAADCGGAANAPKINEFSASTTGADVEYVEVFGDPSTDYSTYAILELEGDANAAMGTVDEVIAVGITNANGLWLGDLPANTLENGSITLLLVEGFTGSLGDDLDSDDDGVLDVAPWTTLVDAVAVSDGGAGDLTFGVPSLGPNYDGISSFPPGGASRIPDGFDTDAASDWVRNDFDLAGIDGFAGSPDVGEAFNTPGASNAVVEVPPCEAAYTPVYAIQGSGASAAITGAVTTKGVVVGDYEGASPTLRGFYLQDPDGDGDPATSDGIFVFNGNNDSVALGDLVVVSGNAGEFQNQTQVSASSIVSCDSGASISPVDVTLPVLDATDLERFEGMLVRFHQTLYVTEHFQLGRFGQVVVSAGDRLAQPTQVALPDAAAAAVQAANDLNRLIIDDALNNQNPDPIDFGRNGDPLDAGNTLRGGDTVTDPVGVLTYTWAGNGASGNAYRLRPIGSLGGSVEFMPTNARPTTAPSVGGTVRVGSFNLLNYFNTFDGLPDAVDNCTNGVGGDPADCRGADTAEELERQAAKTVAAILELDVAVVGVTELENDGYGPTSAIADLVDRLNALAGPGAWAFVDADAGTGTVNALGADAIRVGLLYQPALVTPVGTTAALNTGAFVNGGDSTPRNRAALAQAFQDDADGVFIAVVNHLKSKGSACETPDAGDGQGNCSDVRTNAALELASWLATDPTGTGDPDVLIVGDLNAYAKEDPIAALEGAGYTNLLASFLGSDGYGYVFDGQWGTLDYALASPALEAQTTGAASWHINADEPSVLDYNTNFKSAGQVASLYAADAYRSSDHDPVVVGLDLDAPTCATAHPSVDVLWPPRHQFVSVDVLGVTSANGPVSVVVTSVFQDEPVDAPGDADGSTSPDAMGLGDASVDLRAERDEEGNGRVYHVAFQAADAAGQTCFGSLQVNVPKSQGRNGAPVDDGPLFDATRD